MPYFVCAKLSEIFLERTKKVTFRQSEYTVLKKRKIKTKTKLYSPLAFLSRLLVYFKGVPCITLVPKQVSNFYFLVMYVYLYIKISTAIEQVRVIKYPFMELLDRL